MKKLSVLILVFLCIISLTGCATRYEENVWYSEEKLAECLLPNLPIIEKPLLKREDWKVYTNLTKEEFDDYVQSVYDYLKAQNFEYLGTRGHQKSSLAGALASFYFQPAETLKQHCQSDDYYFVYSDGTKNEGGQLVFWFLGIYRYNYQVDYSGKTFSYNTELTLRKGAEAPATGFYYYDPEHIDPCFFEHTYNEGTTYPIPGSKQTVTIRACINCGHEDYEPFTGDMHSYSLTIVKGKEQVRLLPETHVSGKLIKRPSGMLMKLYTNRLLDADIVCTVNGTVIPKIETDIGWCYAFILPNCDVEISIEVVDGFLPPEE